MKLVIFTPLNPSVLFCVHPSSPDVWVFILKPPPFPPTSPLTPLNASVRDATLPVDEEAKAEGPRAELLPDLPHVRAGAAVEGEDEGLGVEVLD